MYTRLNGEKRRNLKIALAARELALAQGITSAF